MSIHHQPRMRMRRPVVNFYTILSCTSDDLPTVKLQCGNGEFVSMSLGYTACPDIPYLDISVVESSQGSESYPDSLVQSSSDDGILIELQTSDRSSMSRQGPMSLTRSHYRSATIQYLRRERTVPHPHPTISTATSQSVTPEL